jgi:hypothetical protein
LYRSQSEPAQAGITNNGEKASAPRLPARFTQ